MRRRALEPSNNGVIFSIAQDLLLRAEERSAMGRSTKKWPRPTAGPFRLISETGINFQQLHRAESDGAMDELDFLLSVLAATFAAAQSAPVLADREE